MQVRLIRQLWGVEDWEKSFPKIKANGYEAVETPPMMLNEDQRIKLQDLIKKHDLKFVYQVHTNVYTEGRNNDMDHHVNYFREQLRHAKSMGAILCNSHSGLDSWTDEEKIVFFTRLVEVEKEEGIPVCHETHRRRALYNPWTTRNILQRVPDLKICADLSHWFNVCESTLDEMLDIIEIVGRHCILIHGRVGHSQGPQVPDPRAPEWLCWVEAHERCWDIIWQQQKAVGRTYTFFEPEFGPPPYCPVLPFTGMPVTNVWEISEWIKNRDIERFETFNL
jgi:sugar phosphate isomerase/epimerase